MSNVKPVDAGALVPFMETIVPDAGRAARIAALERDISSVRSELDVLHGRNATIQRQIAIYQRENRRRHHGVRVVRVLIWRVRRSVSSAARATSRFKSAISR